MTAGTRLALGGIVVVAATAYMAYVGASDSWKYYLTVDECVAGAGQFMGQRVRVSGQVAADTLQIADDRSQADFSLAGSQGEVQVVCRGLLPDNLAEGCEVVVEGRLEPSGLLRGDKVLTRCASKYESGEVTAHDGRQSRCQSQGGPMRICGELCLLAAFVGSGFAAVACCLGWRRRHRLLQISGLVAAIASVMALTAVMIILAWALVAKDFRFAYVAQYSSDLLPWHYSLSALWVGQAGSLLLWAWLTGVLALLYVVWPGRATDQLRQPVVWRGDGLCLLSGVDHGVRRRSDGAQSVDSRATERA